MFSQTKIIVRLKLDEIVHHHMIRNKWHPIHLSAWPQSKFLHPKHAYELGHMYISLKWDQRVMWWITNESSLRNLSTQLFQWIAFSLHGRIHNFGQSYWCVHKPNRFKEMEAKNTKNNSRYITLCNIIVWSLNIIIIIWVLFSCLLSIQITFPSNFNDGSINYYPSSTQAMLLALSFLIHFEIDIEIHISIRYLEKRKLFTHSIPFCVCVLCANVHMEYLLRVFPLHLHCHPALFHGWLVDCYRWQW